MKTAAHPSALANATTQWERGWKGDASDVEVVEKRDERETGEEVSLLDEIVRASARRLQVIGEWSSSSIKDQLQRDGGGAVTFAYSTRLACCSRLYLCTIKPEARPWRSSWKVI
jgi:hypothetical protein